MANKQIIRLTENQFRQIVKESVNSVLNEGINEYETLYDDIQSVTNDVINFVGMKLFDNEGMDERTAQLLNLLSDAASKFSDIAHEVEEHFAWD